MAAPYSVDLRKKVVSAYLSGYGTIDKISQIFSISMKTVKNYLRQYRNHGDLSPAKPTGRPPIVNNSVLQIIQKIVENDNDKTLDEYCGMLRDRSGVAVSKSTMENALKKLNYNRKKKSFFAEEHSREDVKKKRKDFVDSLLSKKHNNFIFIDESSSDLQMDNAYARAQAGERAKSSKPFVRGQRYSLLSAIGLSGIIEFLLVQLSVTATIFLHFIKIMLCPRLKKGQVVIMDNANIHKSPEIKRAIEKTGAKLVYLPPYSPDLSHIEKMWSKLKHYIKKLKPRTEKEYYNALISSISELNNSDFESWYEACGYVIE